MPRNERSGFGNKLAARWSYFLFSRRLDRFSQRASAEEFPLVLDATSLRQAGVAVSFGSNVPPLDIKCYYYGDGGYLISTSDRSTRNSGAAASPLRRCALGLISETHFDPASGRRLPTYVLADRELLYKDGARPSVENLRAGVGE